MKQYGAVEVVHPGKQSSEHVSGSHFFCFNDVVLLCRAAAWYSTKKNTGQSFWHDRLGCLVKDSK